VEPYEWDATDITKWPVSVTHLSLLSPNINIQILLSDLNTFSYSISWENLFKDQVKFQFPLVIILLILKTVSLDEVLILRGEV